MSQLYMLDTNTVSHIVKGRSLAARNRLALLSSHEIACISVITEAEVRYGLAKIPAAIQLSNAIEAFFSRMHILSWDSAAAAAYGKLRARQEAAGKLLGNLDMLIAAHAIAARAVLVTSDQGFAQVEDLSGRVDWASDI